MSTFVEVLIAVLKIAGSLIALALGAIIAILILPISVSGSGFCKFESNIEEVLDKLDDPEYPESDCDDLTLFLLDYGFTLKTKLFMGLFSVWMSDSEFPYIKILGIKKPLRFGSTGKGHEPAEKLKDEPAHELAGKPAEAKKADEFVELDANSSGVPKKSRQAKKLSFKQLKQLASAPVLSKVKWAIQSVFKAIHLKADLDVELGFPDPSHTGIVYGLFCAYAGAFGVKGVRLHPNFESKLVAVDGSASMWIVPGQLLWIVARFMFDSEIRHLWWKKKSS